MQRKKMNNSAIKFKSKLISKEGNRVGIICQMDYGKGFPTFKGLEVAFEYFENAVLDQRVLAASVDKINASRIKMVEYHLYGLPIDQEFLDATILYISTCKFAVDALSYQKSKSIGFMISIDQVTSEFRTEMMSYSSWEKLKQEMEKMCNKKFIYN